MKLCHKILNHLLAFKQEAVINIIANITSIKNIVIQQHTQLTLVITNIPLINIKNYEIHDSKRILTMKTKI